MHLEAEHLRLIPLGRFLRNKRRVDLEEDVLEGGAEVGAVDVGVAGGLWVVEVFAFAAVEFHGLDVWEVGHAGWEKRVGTADHTGAFAKIAFFIFFELGGLGTSDQR